MTQHWGNNKYSNIISLSPTFAWGGPEGSAWKSLNTWCSQIWVRSILQSTAVMWFAQLVLIEIDIWFPLHFHSTTHISHVICIIYFFKINFHSTSYISHVICPIISPRIWLPLHSLATCSINSLQNRYIWFPQYNQHQSCDLLHCWLLTNVWHRSCEVEFISNLNFSLSPTHLQLWVDLHFILMLHPQVSQPLVIYTLCGPHQAPYAVATMDWWTCILPIGLWSKFMKGT
jgi:hypothetical protein